MSKSKKSTKPKSRSAKPKNPVAPEDHPRPVQTEIPGTELPKIRAIEDAAEDYVTKRDTRQRASEREVESKTKLVDLIHKHQDELPRGPKNEIIYRYSDMLVTLTPTEETLKVKHVEPEESGVVNMSDKAPEDTSEGEA